MIKYVIGILALLVVTVMSFMPKDLEVGTDVLADNGMVMTSIQFKNQSEQINLFTDLRKDIGGLHPDNPRQVKVRVTDYLQQSFLRRADVQPRVVEVANVGADSIKAGGLAVAVLVDLTQPAENIHRQRDIVQHLSSLFCRDNLYITFMLPKGIMTPMLAASQYVIDSYIVPDSPLKRFGNEEAATDTINRPYLYRSVLNTMDKLVTGTRCGLDVSPNKALVVLSDGAVYNEIDNTPIDPQHFQMQEALIMAAKNITSSVAVYYVNINGTGGDSRTTDNDMLKMVCQNTGGVFYDTFTWNDMQNEILQHFNIAVTDYRITLQNPMGLTYYGNRRYLRVEFLTLNDSLLASCSMPYTNGSIHEPVIVGGMDSWWQVVIVGLLLIVLFAIATYFTMQFIIPLVRYRWFRHKYVVPYTGRAMNIKGFPVPDTCYYCKTPFRKGDMIVTKCRHIMHFECWEENGGHCPEHSESCQCGSHFYDRRNIFNPENTTFHLKWIIISMIAVVIIWLHCIGGNDFIAFSIIDGLVKMMFDSAEDKVSGDVLQVVSSRMYQLQLLATTTATCVTLVLAAYVHIHNRLHHLIIGVLLRSLAASLVSTLAMTLDFALVISFGIYDSLIFLDWIALTVQLIATCFFVSYNTRLKVSPRRIVLGSLLMALVMALFWEVVGTPETMDSDMLIILTYAILFAVGVILIIAQKMPKHANFKLHVSGAIKEMDIEIHKWLKQCPEAPVTMGKSVDCILQLSWDLQGDVAPLHAEIFLHRGQPYLRAVDSEVTVNEKVLPVDGSVRLYHGDEFIIGKTLFEFREV